MKSVGLLDSQQPFYDMQRENVSVYDVHFNHKHTERPPVCACVCVKGEEAELVVESV